MPRVYITVLHPYFDNFMSLYWGVNYQTPRYLHDLFVFCAGAVKSIHSGAISSGVDKVHIESLSCCYLDQEGGYETIQARWGARTFR